MKMMAESPIFTKIYADISQEFQELCVQSFPSSNWTPNFPCIIQKVCDLTGAVFVQGNESKVAGSWQTMNKVHNLLSGLILYCNFVNEFPKLNVQLEEQWKASSSDVNKDLEHTILSSLRPKEKHVESKRVREMYSLKDNKVTPNRPNMTNVDHDNESNLRDWNKPEQICSQLARENMHGDSGTDGMYYNDVQIVNLSDERHSLSDDQRNHTLLNSEGYSRSASPESSAVIPKNQSDDLEYAVTVNPTDEDLEESNQMENMGETSHESHGDNCAMFPCNDCYFAAQSKRNLQHHRVRVHERPWKCKCCDKGFGMQKDLQCHYKSIRSCKVYRRPIRDPPGLHNPNVKPGYTVFNTVDDGVDNTETDSKVNGKQQDKLTEVTSDRIIPNSENQDNTYTEEKNDQFGESYYKIKTEIFDNDSSQNSEDISKGSSMEMDADLAEQTASVDGQERNSLDSPKFMYIKQEPLEDNCRASTDTCSADVYGLQIQQSSTEEGDSCSLGTSASQQTVSSHSVYNSQPANKNDSHLKSLLFGSSRPVSFGMAVTVQRSNEHVSDARMYLCSSCDYKANSVKKVDDHIHRVHYKTFECSICMALFGLQKDLTRHYRKTHKMIIECQRRKRKSRGHQWSKQLD